MSERQVPTLAEVDDLLAEVLALKVPKSASGGRHPVQPALDLVAEARRVLAEYRAAQAGTMLAAVQADLESMELDKVLGARTYKATALWLADVIDKRGTDDGPSTTAKLADQLTKVLGVLTRTGGDGGGDDGFTQWQQGISEPVIQP